MQGSSGTDTRSEAEYPFLQTDPPGQAGALGTAEAADRVEYLAAESMGDEVKAVEKCDPSRSRIEEHN
jgi:hypothetical protein